MNLLDNPPLGLDCLPCPVLGYRDAPGFEGSINGSAREAANMLLDAASRGYTPKWISHMQINLPLKDLLGKYRHIVENTLVNLEVGFDGPTLDRLSRDDLEEAKALLSGRRLTSHLPFIDLRPASADARVGRVAMQRLNQAADMAMELGARQAVMHMGYDHRLHRDLAGFAERMAKNLQPLLRKMQENGCRLALENVWEPGPEPLLAVLKTLGDEPGLGICLDLGHVYGFSQTPLSGWWPAVAPHVIELHLHDNDGLDDLHWPIGWGKVDWQMLYDGIKGLDTQPVFTLEPHNEPHLWASFRGLERVWGPPEELIRP